MKVNKLELLLELIILAGYIDKTQTTGGIFKTEQKHRTQKAAEKANELRCYTCDSTIDSKSVEQSACMNIQSYQKDEESDKCRDDNRTCMVKKVTFSSMRENSTMTHKTWSIQRSCAHRCEAGCIVIGERNKIFVCWTCCDTPYCNNGTGGASITKPNILLLLSWAPILTSSYLIHFKQILNFSPLKLILRVTIALSTFTRNIFEKVKDFLEFPQLTNIFPVLSFY